MFPLLVDLGGTPLKVPGNTGVAEDLPKAQEEQHDWKRHALDPMKSPRCSEQKDVPKGCAGKDFREPAVADW